MPLRLSTSSMSKCRSHLLNRTWQSVQRRGPWAINYMTHMSLGRWMFKSLLRRTFEPPWAEFRALSEFLRIKQGKRDVHSYIQYILHLTSCITVDPLNQQTLITLFMQGLTDGPVKTYLFRLEFNTLEEAIRVAEIGRLQRETGSREFKFLSSVETTGKWRHRTNGIL